MRKLHDEFLNLRSLATALRMTIRLTVLTSDIPLCCVYNKTVNNYHENKCLLCQIDKLHDYVFRLLSSHSQVIKVHRIKIIIVTSVM